MYSVAQIAEICNISKSTAYRAMRELVTEKSEHVISERNGNNRKCFYVDADGLELLRAKYVHEASDGSGDGSPEPDEAKVSVLVNSDYIEFLKEQIRMKDEQIQMLIEQNSNLQTIIQTMNVKQLTTRKSSFLSWLFGPRKENNSSNG